MKLSDLEKHLRAQGCSFGREGGNHRIWKNSANGKSAAVPRHRDVPPGTVRKICQDLEIELPRER
ncbi:MAG: type II toxin-antitoxin system HicA family toxin [Fimbriimonadaceae bacterium]|nr:type II toxin-antitoxin system HicA family toxin [Fimbriimonadaceae bacterium]